MADAPDDPLKITMAARIWSGIDGGADNVAAMAAVNGETDLHTRATDIRQAGWDQVPWVDGEWPPMDQDIELTLTRQQWELVLGWAEEDVKSYDELGDPESAEMSRNAIEAIQHGLH